MAKIGLINELKEQLLDERAVYNQLDARRAVYAARQEKALGAKQTKAKAKGRGRGMAPAP